VSSHHAAKLAKVTEAVLGSRAETSPGLRRAVESRAAVIGGREGAPEGTVPDELAALVEKIARHAYKVTDDDIASLRAKGYSEDALFEVIVSAALGAGRARFERGIKALRGESA
jgi:alkylhydroperoxidase family enzyme